MRISNFLLVALCSFTITVSSCKKHLHHITSPDGAIEVAVGTDDGHVYYTVKKKGQLLLDTSFLGFQLKDGPFDHGFEITHITHRSFSDRWEQIWGEELTVENNYREMQVDLQEASGKSRKLRVVFRVFDDGLGFRYEFPEQPNLQEFVILDERTEFNFAANNQAWSIPYGSNYYEALYTRRTLHELDTVCTPLTIQTTDSIFMALHEANLTDYAAMNVMSDGKTNRLKVFLTPWSNGDKVRTQAPSVTPWRTLVIADSAGELVLSRLMLNLNEPSKIKDTSWLRPGRYMGIWWDMHMGRYTWEVGPKHGATTENTKRYLDFASKHGFSGVLVEGWNTGWENDWTQEGDQFNFTAAYPDFDIEDVTSYAKRKGVVLIGHHETGGAVGNYEQQVDSAFAWYQKHGVSIVKTGYVSPLLDGVERHSSQYGVRHFRKVIETAAKYQIMIDNHEPVMPTGLQRTYPNLMTQEGVRGQEWDAWDPAGGNPPDHTTIIPFTRGLAGPMDFTPGTFDFENPIYPQTRVETTLAKQLALSVVLYSPLQMASDRLESYERFPDAFSFITSCPASWAETLVPHAAIGTHITVARKDRASDDWYIGSITNGEARQLTLPLDFLDDNVPYQLTIYRDGPQADYERNPYDYVIEERDVDATQTLTLHLARGGGAALRFHPLSP
ncbi:glycoside hydrolase family 97 protein [Sphingobacterium phlebotomi]|uniref:Glycoside hydrolase family 97 protein n=1 Tax=Sphingobacterium phlebotomi TaxID=2605433 RepID=A0A5D4H732_9SPHI|nr:glycoside hydrolase family 97 protein [Sphingobacterium phlebotomi]TYR36861.1 glycoside hydrolase family 97 protein [Sphingobacterium phlebotomi]